MSLESQCKAKSTVNTIEVQDTDGVRNIITERSLKEQLKTNIRTSGERSYPMALVPTPDSSNSGRFLRGAFTKYDRVIKYREAIRKN